MFLSASLFLLAGYLTNFWFLAFHVSPLHFGYYPLHYQITGFVSFCFRDCNEERVHLIQQDMRVRLV